MATWQGALVRVDDPSRLRELAERYRIVLSAPSSPWLLIDVEPRLGKLGPPSFAQGLSRDMKTSVIAFFLQSTVSTERIEHWENGQLLRELEYYLDGGGWIAQRGTPQAWEGAYFFSDEEGTATGQQWPNNLGDEISTGDILRYEQARAQRTAEPVMDLLMGGSIERLCEFYGVDTQRPGGYYRSPPNFRLWAWLLAIALVFVSAILCGAIRR